MPTWLKNLPLEIRLAALGLSTLVFLVVIAVAVRSTPFEDVDAEAGTARPPNSAAPAPNKPANPGAPGTTAAAPQKTAAPPVNLSSDAREVRAQFRKDLQFGRFKDAVKALARLLELAPKSPEDAEIRADIVELAMRVMLIENSNEPEVMFELISSKMGTTGGDILYELLTTRGGSRAAKRAEELLKEEPVRARATPAMRIAYELRVASGCDEKIALFERAKADGDGRTLGQLQLLNRSCGRRSGSCCLHNDPKLRETMDAIKTRLN